MTLTRFPFRAMAAGHELLLGGADEGVLAHAAQAAIADVARIETKYSRYRDDSVTTRINRGAGGPAIAIDAETAALLRYADACHTQSGGLFDLTSGVLRAAWDFKATPPALPTSDALAAAIARIGWRDVEWDDRQVRLRRAGMELDFGGIGKEYAADRVATLCIEAGVPHGCANLGGDVRVWGSRPDGSPWRIGIRHPRREGAAIVGVDVHDGALATSGDYERFIEVDGHRYCHILDPRTGMPVTAWQSLSVVAPLAVVAGSYATIGMLLGMQAPAVLAAAGLRWLGVDADGALRDSATAAA